MANKCFYRMKIVGEKEKINELIKALDDKSKMFPGGVGRVFSVCVIERNEDSAIVEGDCAWSVQSAMYNLDTIVSDLKLSVEIFSEEVGFAFEEHRVYTDGVLDIDECVDKYEFCVEEFESDDAEVWKNELIQEEGITPENYKEYLNDNNCIEVGGFGDWEFSI